MDIAKCSGKVGASEKDCPLKEQCFRFKAPVTSEHQYYISAPYDFKKKDCGLFWPNVLRESE